MTRILVSGYYGFGNAGDEAILAGLIQAFRTLDPAVSITVISGKAARTRELHGVEAVSRNRLARVWQAIGAADLVISGGGSLLQDVTGFRSIPYYLGVVTMGLLQGKPVMFYGQGVGPINRSVSKALVRLVVNRVTAVTVRDQESADLLRRLGVRRPPITVTADAALALPPGDRAEGRRLLAGAGAPMEGVPLLGVSVRRWRNHPDYEAALVQALDELHRSEGCHPVFIPMQPSDEEAAAALAARLSAPALVLGPADYRSTLHLVAGCDAMLGMRYHALVFAAMAGVPLVGLSYDPKNDNFLRRLGLRAAGTTEAVTAAAVTDAVRAALRSSPDEMDRRRRIMDELSRQSLANARMALGLLQQGVTA